MSGLSRLFVAAVCSCLLTNVASVGAQALADVARQEEARRQAVATTSRVYTNADLNKDRPAPSLTTITASTPKASTAASADPSPSGDVVSSYINPPSAAPVAVSRLAPIDPQPDPATPAGETRNANVTASPPATPESPAPSAAPSIEGWSTFSLKKTAKELADEARLSEAQTIRPRAQATDIRLPPQRDLLHMTTGVAYLQGTDWGGEVTGFGQVHGVQTDLNTFLTAGPLGLQARTGRVSLFDPVVGWGAEGGDLYSDIWGLARGARFSWDAGENRRPAISFYVDGGPSQTPRVVTYRDEFAFLSRYTVGGEVSSNGATFVRGGYRRPRARFDVFYRLRPEIDAAHDEGISASVDLGRGVGLSGGVRFSDAATDASVWKLVSVRIPLAQRASLTVERNWWTSTSTENAMNALVVQMPVGRIQLTQRVQWGESAILRGDLPVGFSQRQSQSSAAYSPVRWASFSYQTSTQWQQDGRGQQWDELYSTFRIGRATTLQMVTAVSDFGNPQRLRGRLTRQLPNRFSLDAEYGYLSAFQNTRTFDGERARILVMIRKRWDLGSPARGGDVEGGVRDQAGLPVSDAVVQLGAYRTITDAEGRYAFHRVPNGNMDLLVDKEKLPAIYASDEAPRAITVTRGSRTEAELHVIPLNTLRGFVYWDRNHNGRLDEKEGLPGIVVWLNDTATATDENGSFAFYNQAPGPVTVRLDVSRLPDGVVAASSTEQAVELPADRPLLDVTFVVDKPDRPVIMQELRR